MKKHSGAALLLTCTLLAGAIPFTTYVHADSVDELKAKQEAAEQKAAKLAEKKEAMEEALSDLSSELYTITMNMNETAEQLENCRLEMENTRLELEDAKALSAQHYEATKERIRFFYETSSQSVLTSLFHSGNVIDYVNSVSMISDFTKYDREKLKEFQKTQQEIEQKSRELDELETQLVDKKAAFTEQQQLLLADISKQQTKLQNTQASLADQQAQSQRLREQINTMIAYENMLRAQQNPYEDQYYIKATSNGYSSTTYYGSNPTYMGAINYTQQEFDILSALIYCEAGGEPYEVQLAVGSTVMNRLRSPLFPDTLLGVIYQHKQFTPVLTGRHAVVLERGLTTDSCRNAARYVLNGNSTGDWLFFRVDKEHKINGTHMGVSVFY